ncbi:MAG: Tricarboxylate transport protein TctC, partial [Rhodoferax sp.]|nr:Tricarboxylate transport protein TctC [Rhodoferax sp.]
MNIQRRRTLAATGTLLALGSLRQAWAQPTDWPKKPIRIIVPSGPGGSSDILLRLMTEPLARLLGQPIVVDNKPGAGGTLAATLAAQAEPDGYTLMMNSVATHGIGPSMYKLRFDPDAGVTGICELAATANVLYVRRDSPLKTMHELVAYAKANPGKLNYASSGAGTSLHLSAVAFAQAAGIEVTHIPYNGAAPAMQAVLGGDAAFSFENATPMMGQIRGGTVLPLAVTTASRASQLPDVPTVAEAGLAGFEVASWFGIVAPGGLPRLLVDRLSVAFDQVLKQP